MPKIQKLTVIFSLVPLFLFLNGCVAPKINIASVKEEPSFPEALGFLSCGYKAKYLKWPRKMEDIRDRVKNEPLRLAFGEYKDFVFSEGADGGLTITYWDTNGEMGLEPVREVLHMKGKKLYLDIQHYRTSTEIKEEVILSGTLSMTK